MLANFHASFKNLEISKNLIDPNMFFVILSRQKHQLSMLSKDGLERILNRMPLNISAVMIVFLWL